ncbi:MAG: flavodoxin family protein [bacterium]
MAEGDREGRRIKVLGIVGSPHREGMTFRLVESALKGASSEGADITLLRLADEELEACLGCGGGCFETQICVRDPIATFRHARLQDADGLVMGVPVYCWQMNGLTSLFIDKMRWNTGSVLKPRNPRVAFGIACAGGSGTGCVLALQALYRYFYNWAFHGVSPLPVTRFNFQDALEEAGEGGRLLVRTIRQGIEPFSSLGEAMAHYESLPYMDYGPIDELRLIVRQQMEGLMGSSGALVRTLRSEAEAAEEAFARGDRAGAAEHLSRAYEAGREAWDQRGRNPEPLRAD